MAQIKGTLNEKVYTIGAWLGLHESPDGDTKLKTGEAAVVRNFRITRDGNLQKRPGTHLCIGLHNTYNVTSEIRTVKLYQNASVTSGVKLYPNKTNKTTGFIELSGEPVVVTKNNWRDYVGWYMQRAVGQKTYQLVSVEVGTEFDKYDWTFTEIASVPSTGTPVNNLWTGYVGGEYQTVAACGDKLWKLTENTDGSWSRSAITTVDTSRHVLLFGFDNVLWINDGTDLKSWNGTVCASAEGYVPIVRIGQTPSGQGTLLEQINKLTAKRRVWLSPTGTDTDYPLPETATTVDYVKDLATDTEYTPTTDYTFEENKVKFTSAPAEGTNTIEVCYAVATDYRDDVLAMTYHELYNGALDTRVFLYGNGTNGCIYSGVDYNGSPRADYFPDLNVMSIGDSNTPITAMIRHYSKLIVFKTDSSWSVAYGTVTTEDNTTVATFYATPVNRAIGNAALGQAQLVLNSPYTLYGNDIYEWRNNSSYTSNLSVDERQAKRISDRVYRTLTGFKIEDCKCFDFNAAQEYYVCYDGKALVYNYAADAWTVYTDFDAVCMCDYKGRLLFGDSHGYLKELSEGYVNDCGEPIKAYWESGSLTFGTDYMRKYSAAMWVGLKPETNSEIWATVVTDRKTEYAEKDVTSDMFSFADMSFSRFTFKTNHMPQMEKLKIKAKKFVFYKLIFKSDALDTRATVLSTDIKVRYTGYTK